MPIQDNLDVEELQGLQIEEAKREQEKTLQVRGQLNSAIDMQLQAQAAPGTQEKTEEEKGGTVDDIFTGVVSGLAQAAGEIPQSLVDIADTVAPDWVSEEWEAGATSQWVKDGLVDLLESPVFSGLNEMASVGTDGSFSERIENGPDDTAGHFAREFTRNAAAFVGVGKFAKIANIGQKFAKNHKFVSMAVREAVADGISVDPREERLFDLMKEFDATASMGEFMGTDVNDAPALARLKAVAEGSLIGGAIAPIQGLIARKMLASKHAREAIKGQWTKGSDLTDIEFEKIDSVMGEVIDKRNAADDLITMSEWYHTFRSDSPVVGELRDTFAKNADQIDEGNLSAEAQAMLANIRTTDPDVDVWQYLNNLEGLTPRQLMDQVDTGVGQRVDELMGVRESGMDNATLQKAIQEAEAQLEVVERKFRAEVLSEPFERADVGVRNNWLRAAFASRRSKSQGGRTLVATDNSYDVLAAELTARGLSFDEEIIPRLGKRKAGENVAGQEIDITKVPVKVFGKFKLAPEDATAMARIASSGVPLRQAAVEIGERFFAGDAGVSNFKSLVEADSTDHFYESFEGIAKYVSNLLYERGSDAAKVVDHVQTHKAAKKIVAEEIAERGLKNEAELSKLMDDAFGKQKAGRRPTEDLAARTVASKMVLQQAQRHFNKLSNPLGTKARFNMEARAELLNAAQFLADAWKLDRGIATDLGRGLNARKIKVDLGMTEGAFNNIMNQAYGNPKKLVDQLTSMRNFTGREVADLMSKSGQAHSMWVSGLLSNPATWAVNAISTSLNMTVLPIERALGAAFRGQVREAASHVGSLGRIPMELTQAFKAGRAAWRDGIGTTISGTGVSAHGPLSGTMHNVAESKGVHSLSYKMVKAMDSLYSIPGKVLISTDEFHKSIAFSMEAHRLVKQHLVKTRPHLRGADFEVEAKRMVDMARRPEQMSNIVDGQTKALIRRINKNSSEAAKRATFTEDLGDGALGSMAERIHANPMGRFLVPFVRTPANVMKQTIARVPIMDALIKDERVKYGAMFKGDGTVIAEKAASYSISLMTLAAVGEMVANGQITGQGPLEPSHRATWLLSNQPNSIKLFGNWYRYDRLAPAGTYLGMATDLSELSQDMEEDEAIAGGAVLVELMTNRMKDLSFMQGIFEFINAVDDPARMPQYLAKQAGTLVPMSSAMRAVRNTVDDTQRSTVGVVDNSSNGFLQALNQIKNTIPGLSEGLPPRLNIFGEPMVKPAAYGFNVVNPLHSYMDDSVPELQALSELEIPMNMASFTKKNGLALTGEQTNQWIMAMNRGDRLKKRIMRLMRDKSFIARPKQMQEKIVKKILTKARSNGFKAMLRAKGNEDLRLRYKIASLRRTSSGSVQSQSRIERLKSQLS